MSSFHNILVYSLVNLGDVLLTTSAVALLKQAYPQAKITMMVRPAAAGLVENNSLFDQVILYDYKGRHKSWRGMWKLVERLRRERFDLCISFDRKLRPALLAWFAGIPVRVGPDKVFDDDKSWVTMLYTHTIPILHDLDRTLQAETYQSIIRGFTGINGSAKPVMGRTLPDQEEKARDLLRSLGPRTGASLYMAFCVKGTFALKNWPQEYFARLLQRLQKEYPGAKFFIVGAPEDREYAQDILDRILVPVGNFCGETSLPELAALLRLADVFITVDTGAAHIAATVDVPMLVLYGCTSPERWHPLSDKAIVLSSGEACCPCQRKEDECSFHECMTTITVEQVMNKIHALLRMA